MQNKTLKRILIIYLGAFCLFYFSLEGRAEEKTKKTGFKNMYATIKTNMGEFTIKLFYKQVPKTVENFVGLAEGTKEYSDAKTGKKIKGKYYDGTIFHRIIDDFMIQGGDPTGTGRGGPGYTFEDEFVSDLKHDEPGIVSMANAGPNTNGSQFFITLKATPWLDGRHSVFGKVVKGLEIIEKIGKVDTLASDRPKNDVIIESISISRK